jgi:ribose 1,5-bisphosphokinase PhnN
VSESDVGSCSERQGRSIDLINVSGPYGSGKDSLIDAVLRKFGSRVHRVKTLTTRESSAVVDPSYTTLADDEFRKATRDPNWIVNYQLSGAVAYATDLREIQEASAAGKLCVHTIFGGDIGAGELRRRLAGRVISVGLQVNGGGVEQQLATLRNRLQKRGRDSDSEIERRLSHQSEVINYIVRNPKVVANDGRTYRVFDYRIMNQDLALAVAEFIAMAAASLDGSLNPQSL